MSSEIMKKFVRSVAEAPKRKSVRVAVGLLALAGASRPVPAGAHVPGFEVYHKYPTQCLNGKGVIEMGTADEAKVHIYEKDPVTLTAGALLTKELDASGNPVLDEDGNEIPKPLILLQNAIGVTYGDLEDGDYLVAAEATFDAALNNPDELVQVRCSKAIIIEDEKQGYRMVAADGGEFTFGDTKFFGSNVNRNNPEIPIVGIADSATGSIQVDARGNVFTKGDTVFHGSIPAEQLPADDSVVGIALNKDGSYRLATAQGRVFGFGGANADVLEASGDTDPAFKYNQPIVGIVASPDGNGYWLVAEDGGVFANGDAGFYGSTGGIKLNKRVVGMGVTPSGNGYWLVAEDGGVFAFGDAPFLGSTGSIRLNQPIVGIQSSSTSTLKSGSTGVNHNFGYRMVAKDGGVFSYGNAHFLGSLGGIPLHKEVVAVAA